MSSEMDSSLLDLQSFSQYRLKYIPCLDDITPSTTESKGFNKQKISTLYGYCDKHYTRSMGSWLGPKVMSFHTGTD